MPIFTSLLFLFLALAILPLAFRGSRARQTRREQSELQERMSLGASICIAAAREAFGVELDHSRESVSSLNTLINDGWPASTPQQSDPNSESDSSELSFVLAAYLGSVFVLHCGAEWRIENGKPVLFFRSIAQSEYPFELLELKLREPGRTNLATETAHWGLATEPASTNPDEQPAE